jgi:HlyD family secretion protein
VTYVPIQAVTPMDGKQYCLVANGGTPDRRLVEVGQFNDEFIEIKNGLKEGERVLLRPAEAPSSEKADEEKAPSPAEKQKSAPRPATPAAGPVPGAVKQG